MNLCSAAAPVFTSSLAAPTLRFSRFAFRVSVALVLSSALSGRAQPEPATAAEFSTQAIVGQLGTNRYYTPANQILTPAGLQVELPGLRPQALALSPDGRLLVTAGKTPELVVLRPSTGAIRQRVPLPSETGQDPTPGPVSEGILDPEKAGQLSFTGLAFSPDGSRIYLANVDGSLKVFGVRKERPGKRLVHNPLAAGQRPRP